MELHVLRQKWEITSSQFKARNYQSAKRIQQLPISQPAMRKPYAQQQIASGDREAYLEISMTKEQEIMRNLGTWPAQPVAASLDLP